MKLSCCLRGCENDARGWIKLGEKRFIPVCTPCKKSFPKELKGK